MRVIAGSLKSRKLEFPKTPLTRPVTDRAKETIFNILGERVESKKVLDLFTGSGSFGIEALSRGAQSACFVDHAPICTQCVTQNLSNLNLTAVSQVIQSDVEKVIQRFQKSQFQFNLIFLDPPYDKGYVKKVLQLLDRSDIVPPNGLIVIGHSQREHLPEHLNTLLLERQLKLGQAFISFVKRANETDKK